MGTGAATQAAHPALDDALGLGFDLLQDPVLVIPEPVVIRIDVLVHLVPRPAQLQPRAATCQPAATLLPEGCYTLPDVTMDHHSPLLDADKSQEPRHRRDGDMRGAMPTSRSDPHLPASAVANSTAALS